MHGTEEASNDGKVKVHIIHGLNISHKELTYLLQKSISHQKKVLRACRSEERRVGKECIISRGLDALAKFPPTLNMRKGNARYRRG